ncbi:MAG TPA: ABC transporter ATP-binding protein [Terriglobia bacterium]|nr:ABC transporter ATP-binding protein [Terriglobia bacterium]
MWAVETTELTKEYRLGFWRNRRKRALEGLTLAVEEGEVFGLLGPNGAGKSTTLKLLFRLIFPTSGSGRILGRPLSDVRARARVGYLPETPSFYDHLTAQELMHYAGWLCGLDPGVRRARAQDLLEQVGLAEAAGLAIRKFSKGMVQRLGIAQALVNDPEVIFLDEPMSGLDPLGRRQVRDLILALRKRGKTVFFSTHILSDAETLCDRVAILHRGRLQGLGSLREILAGGVASNELVLEAPSPQTLEALARFTSATVRTGDQVRLELAANADASTVLGAALGAGASIVSFNPVKMSLEDYFMARLGTPSERPLAPRLGSNRTGAVEPGPAAHSARVESQRP